MNVFVCLFFLFFEQEQIKSGALTDKQPPVVVLRALPLFWSPGLGTSMTATILHVTICLKPSQTSSF